LPTARKGVSGTGGGYRGGDDLQGAIEELKVLGAGVLLDDGQRVALWIGMTGVGQIPLQEQGREGDMAPGGVEVPAFFDAALDEILRLALGDVAQDGPEEFVDLLVLEVDGVGLRHEKSGGFRRFAVAGLGPVVLAGAAAFGDLLRPRPEMARAGARGIKRLRMRNAAADAGGAQAPALERHIADLGESVVPAMEAEAAGKVH
jgi:hypothetical protein